MDDKRFDELSRRLAVPLTRGGFVKTLSALGGTALAAITGLDLAEAKKGNGGKKGHGGKKGNGGKKKGKGGKKGHRGQQGNDQSARNDPSLTAQKACAADHVLICHSGNGSNYVGNCPSNSAVCQQTGPGHCGHEFDCVCGPSPLCPGVCDPPIPTCASIGVECSVANG